MALQDRSQCAPPDVKVGIQATSFRLKDRTGTPPKGYRVRDLTGSLGVQSIALKPNELTLKGGGAGLAYTLNETSQGRMALGSPINRAWSS